MSLNDLATLNANLIRSAVAPQVESGDALGEFVNPVVGPDLEDEGGSWSSAAPFEYRQTVDWIRTNIFGGSVPSGMSTFITAFADGWAEKVLAESGGEGGGGHFPTLDELLQNDDFQNGVAWLPYIRARLPSVFTTEGDGGGMLMARSDPLTGVRFVEIAPPTPLQVEIRSGADMGQEVTRGPGGAIELSPRNEERVRQMGESAPGQTEVELDPADRKFVGGAATAITGAPQTLQDLLKENPELKSLGMGSGVPHIGTEELASMLNGSTATATSGGGGGGGGGRRDLVFDKAHLMAQVADLYEGWMLEEADDAEVERIVDDYIREAKGFWSKDGGQLDFDTAIRSDLKALPQFKLRYRKMPGWMEPEQYLSQFAGPVGQLGLRADTARDETVAAMTSGGSPTEQLRRIGRTREAQQSRPFSQELASTVAGLGAGARF